MIMSTQHTRLVFEGEIYGIMEHEVATSRLIEANEASFQLLENIRAIAFIFRRCVFLKWFRI